MEVLALYLLKSAVCNAVFLGVYACFFKNQTFFQFNRHFLITGILLSLLLPLYTYTHEVTSMTAELGTPTVQPTSLYTSSIAAYILIAGYGLGVLFFVGRYILGLIKIKTVISRAGFSLVEDYRLVNTLELKSSFSVFNYIFIDTSSDLSETEKQLILTHELAHVRQYHWADLLLMQLFVTMQWLNPIAWLYMKAIRENHEYLADQAVLEQGTSAAVYRAVLVNHCIGTRVFSFSSSFYEYGMPRLKMLSRAPSGGINKVFVALILPAVALFYWSFSETRITIKTVPAKKIVRTPVSTTASKDSENVVATRPAQAIKKLNRLATKPSLSSITKLKADSANASKTVEESTSTSVVASSPSNTPLYFLDGVEVPASIKEDIDPNTIASVHVRMGESAVKEIGERGRNGVVMLYTKSQVKQVY